MSKIFHNILELKEVIGNIIKSRADLKENCADAYLIYEGILAVYKENYKSARYLNNRNAAKLSLEGKSIEGIILPIFNKDNRIKNYYTFQLVNSLIRSDFVTITVHYMGYNDVDTFIDIQSGLIEIEEI